MAAPGRFQYVLDGKDVAFVNSNDNKIIIRSEAPEISINDAGFARPETGTVTIDEQTPKSIGIVEPTTASLTLSGTTPVFPAAIVPSVGSLSLSGKTPELGAQTLPGTASIVITEQTPARLTGIKIDGQAPSAVAGIPTTTPVGSMSFSATAPDVYRGNARVPQKKSVTLSGNAPMSVVANTVTPGTDALTIQGRLTNIYDSAYPVYTNIFFSGYAPTLLRSEGQVTVLIEGPFEYGTFIRNKTATTDVPVNYQIDDRTGFKAKVKDVLVKEYTGHLVRPDSLDKQSEQEFLRSKSDGGKGPQRPEPVGDETFVEDEYPNGVSADDL